MGHFILDPVLVWLTFNTGSHKCNFWSILSVSKDSFTHSDCRNHSHYIQEISILITWLETDTNSFRSSLMESERSENVDISGTLGLSLTKFEKEYYEFQLNRHGTKSNLSVIRDIQFLRYSEIKFEGLHKLHLRCCDDTQRSKSRDYNQKIQNLMFKWSNQRVLEVER